MKRLIRVLGCAIAASFAAVTATADSPNLMVHDAWIAATPPGATVAAGYLKLMNAGEQDMTVAAAESPACERIEFHNIEMDGDVARMRPQDSLFVPSGEKLTLSSRGLHLMLIRPQSLAAGDRVPIRLTLGDGTEIQFEAVVRATGHNAHEHHSH